MYLPFHFASVFRELSNYLQKYWFKIFKSFLYSTTGTCETFVCFKYILCIYSFYLKDNESFLMEAPYFQDFAKERKTPWPSKVKVFLVQWW